MAEDRVSVRIFWLKDWLPNQPYKRGAVVLDVECRLRTFAGAVLAASQRVHREHPVLGVRLRECAEAALQVEGRSARDIFGSTDEQKLRSSATLFVQVSPEGSVFHRLLDRYFEGQADRRTLELLDRGSGGG